MQKPSKPVPARPTTKSPGGQQEKWTRRLQSVADQRATEAATRGQGPGAGVVAGQKAGKASGVR
jgi:hypothetical protein